MKKKVAKKRTATPPPEPTPPKPTRKYLDWKDVNVLHGVRDAVLAERLYDLEPSLKEITLRVIKRMDPEGTKPKTPQALVDALQAKLGQTRHKIQEGLRKAEEGPKVVEQKVPAEEIHKHYSLDQLTTAMGRAFAAQLQGAIKHATAPLNGVGGEEEDVTPPKSIRRILLAGFLPQQCRDIESYAARNLRADSVEVEIVSLPKDAEVSQALPRDVDAVVLNTHMSKHGRDRLRQKYWDKTRYITNGISQATAHIRQLYETYTTVDS